MTIQQLIKRITSVEFDQSEIDKNGTYSQSIEFEGEEYVIQCEVIAEVTKYYHTPETHWQPEETNFNISIDDIDIKNIICPDGLDHEPPSEIYNELVKELIKYVEI
jgi:hypothetical protein